MGGPRVRSATVVVCTFRRPAGLIRTLGGLAGQADPGLSWDVVVVDNDDQPGVAAAYATARPSLVVSVRLVHEARRGSAHARNRGIAESTGDIVAMLDDDVVPAPDWLSRLLEPIVHDRFD